MQSRCDDSAVTMHIEEKMTNLIRARLFKSPSSHVDSRPKNHASLAQTSSPGILVRWNCGKST